MDPGLNSLLKWSIENSEKPAGDVATTAADTNNPTTSTVAAPTQSSESNGTRSLNASALKSLLGGPSDADLMKAAMATILNPDDPLEEKINAFDNFEQLIESIDNANNLAPLGLWAPLISLLSHDRNGQETSTLSATESDVNQASTSTTSSMTDHAQIPLYAAWCLGTAVQNNPAAQERALVHGAIPTLAALATTDSHEGVRRKAAYALSSEVRNYQPGLDEMMRCLAWNGEGEEGIEVKGKVDAADMDAVDRIMERVRGDHARRS